jgi:integrase/recombinase XerD
MSQQVSPLRQRMIEDMTIRNMSPSTQKVYVAAVANFSIFHGRSPDKLTFEDVRDYRLHLISRGLKPNSVNPIMGALRFFYRTTLGLKEVSENIPYARRADPLPAVLARDEVERFLKAVPNLKMRTAFITIYAAGLRVSEAVKLTARDIDSARMVIIIRQAKGRKDRYVMLSEQLLGILRDYWKRERPQTGYSQDAQDGGLRRASCNASFAMPPALPASIKRSRSTHCGTASPPISWSRASTFT